MKNDIAMKFLLRNCLQQGALAESLIRNRHITKWLNTELSKPEKLMTDLLGEASDGELIHIEVQSTNDPNIAFRMLRYFVAIYETYGKPCRQIVLYLGRARMQTPVQFEWPHGLAGVTQLDVREMDGRRLLESVEVGDNVIAVLTRLGNERAALQQIIERIATLESDLAAQYFRALLVLAGLRDLEAEVREVGNSMLETSDMLNNKVLGPAFKSGLEQGREEGRQEGKVEGSLHILRRMIQTRFGLLPSWAEYKLAECRDLDALSSRLLSAATLEELFH